MTPVFYVEFLFLMYTPRSPHHFPEIFHFQDGDDVKNIFEFAW